MTTYDYVIRDNQFGTFYYYLDHFEFGGWQTTNNLGDADSFNSIEEAKSSISDTLISSVSIVKRYMTIE
ncbi:hypothetical protein CkP1_0148 [Citrobacter phage CkP1]|nr:hypothetical protein CkP1_0148 [Citrobacter phage CkP1]